MRMLLILPVLLAFLPLQASVGTKKTPIEKKLRSAIQIVPGKFGNALDARTSPAVVEGQSRFRRPPLTVECWAKLNSKKNYNILVASDPKESSLHWELYTATRSGVLSAYVPGMEPAEVRSTVDVCDGKWHYLAMQQDGRSVKLFVDGKQILARQVKRKAGLGPQPGALTIGMVLWKGGRFGCDGLLDEIRISNKIRPIIGVPTKPPLLDLDTVGVWHFDSLAGFAADPAWTPRPVTGANVPAWWKETDKDWVDERLRNMNTGRTFNGTLAHSSRKGRMTALRGTAVRIGLKGEAAVIFDRNQLRLAAGWTGEFLYHGKRRFGLLNTPTAAGNPMFSSQRRPGVWTKKTSTKKHPPATTALPPTWGRYLGMYRHGERAVFAYRIGTTPVLESAWVETRQGLVAISRTIEVGPTEETVFFSLCDLSASGKELGDGNKRRMIVDTNQEITAAALVGLPDAQLQCTNKTHLNMAVPPHKKAVRVKVLLWRGAKKDLSKFTALCNDSAAPGDLQRWAKPGPRQWTKNITTRGQVSKANTAYVIDTLTVPYQNPYRALMFLSGLDFLPNGDIAVSTVHGDVWLVQGVEGDLKKLTWRRFATGMYQPMGLKVVDGKIFVLERGQLTRLHDHNNDGEADFYECFNDHWHIDGGEHSYDTCLETDPDGNFYFFNGGDRGTPTGGCLLRVSKDGRKLDIFATGFRHPIGMSVSPTGIVTGADQEGNWMPATRIDQYRRGGFYGDMRTHHRQSPPKTYDPPLCWLPREMDNSAGGQVWVPKGRFGPFAGQMLHLSYGRCRLLLLLRQRIGETVQAGGVDLGLQFLSGVMRGRFHPKDGHLYVCGMDGWQTAAIRDGCLQRVRYTGKKVLLPVGLHVHANGVRLTFSQPVQKKLAEDVSRYCVDQWIYRWSGDYGSKRWRVTEPNKVGQDRLTIREARLLEDGRTVFLRFDEVRPVMQMQINYDLLTTSGGVVQGTIYNTVHRVAKRFEQ